MTALSAPLIVTFTNWQSSRYQHAARFHDGYDSRRNACDDFYDAHGPQIEIISRHFYGQYERMPKKLS